VRRKRAAASSSYNKQSRRTLHGRDVIGHAGRTPVAIRHVSFQLELMRSDTNTPTIKILGRHPKTQHSSLLLADEHSGRRDTAKTSIERSTFVWPSASCRDTARTSRGRDARATANRDTLGCVLTTILYTVDLPRHIGCRTVTFTVGLASWHFVSDNSSASTFVGDCSPPTIALHLCRSSLRSSLLLWHKVRLVIVTLSCVDYLFVFC